jgi:hypothetical protein
MTSPEVVASKRPLCKFDSQFQPRAEKTIWNLSDIQLKISLLQSAHCVLWYRYGKFKKPGSIWNLVKHKSLLTESKTGNI